MTMTPSAPTDVALIRRLMLENARPFAGRYALAFVFMGLGAAATAATAWLMRDVINEVFVDRKAAMAAPIAGAAAFVVLMKGVAIYGRALVLTRIGAAPIARIPMRLVDKVRLIESGDHAALLAQGGLHARLNALQLPAESASV